MATNNNIVAVIQARIGSTRLPAKAMLSLHGWTVFEWVVRRTCQAVKLSKVIAAIPDSPSNDILERECRRLGLQTFRGSENDVLTRFFLAAINAKATHVVRVCADNPLVDPGEIDNLIEYFQGHGFDYVYNHIPQNNLYPDGLGAEMSSIEALEKIYQQADTPELREHVYSYLWEHPEFFKIGTFDPPDSALHHPEIKLDIDTIDDYILLESIPLSIGIKGIEIISKMVGFNKPQNQ